MRFYPDIKSISPSAFQLWHSSPSSFVKRYFEGEEFTSPYMDFGTQIHWEIEMGFRQVEKQWEDREMHLITEWEGYPLFGIIDSAGRENDVMHFVDYKTGSTAWTESKLKKDLKMEFYAFMFFQKYLTIDTCIGYIEWLKTVNFDIVGSEVVSCTYSRDAVCSKIAPMLSNMIDQVNNAYKNWLF